MWCTKFGKELNGNAKGVPIPVWLVAVIAGIGVIAVAGVTVLLLNKKDSNTEVADTTEIQTTVATTEAITTEEVTEDITEESIEEWRQLYADFIRQESQNYQRVYAASDSNYDDERYICQYALAYIDSDDIPELLLVYNDSGTFFVLEGETLKALEVPDYTYATTIFNEYRCFYGVAERESLIIFGGSGGAAADGLTVYRYNGDTLLEKAVEYYHYWDESTDDEWIVEKNGKVISTGKGEKEMKEYNLKMQRGTDDAVEITEESITDALDFSY